MEDLIIFGAGDVGKFIAYNRDLFGKRYNLAGFIDADPGKTGTSLCGLPVYGPDYLDRRGAGKLNIVVAISSPRTKEKIVRSLEPYGAEYPNLIAGNSWLSNGITLGRGIIIYPNCSIEHETEIGDFVTVNAGCTIGHNTILSRYANLSPGVHLAGYTNVGEGADLGIGCCTKQGIRIGAYSIAGGQSMLINDVEPGRTVVGVPAMIKK